MPTPRFLTLDDVAEILNVSWSQAYALVRRKELIAIQIGGRGQWRVEVDELERFIQQKYAEARAGTVPDHPETTGPGRPEEDRPGSGMTRVRADSGQEDFACRDGGCSLPSMSSSRSGSWRTSSAASGMAEARRPAPRPTIGRTWTASSTSSGAWI